MGSLQLFVLEELIYTRKFLTERFLHFPVTQTFGSSFLSQFARHIRSYKMISLL